MLGIILLLLIIFWFLGYIQIPGFSIPNLVLFSFNNHPITLFNLIIFALIAWAIGLLPSPFWEVAMFLLVLWLLSIFGIIVIVGLPNILVIIIITALVLYLVSA